MKQYIVELNRWPLDGVGAAARKCRIVASGDDDARAQAFELLKPDLSFTVWDGARIAAQGASPAGDRLPLRRTTSKRN